MYRPFNSPFARALLASLAKNFLLTPYMETPPFANVSSL